MLDFRTHTGLRRSLQRWDNLLDVTSADLCKSGLCFSTAVRLKPLWVKHSWQPAWSLTKCKEICWFDETQTPRHWSSLSEPAGAAEHGGGIIMLQGCVSAAQTQRPEWVHLSVPQRPGANQPDNTGVPSAAASQVQTLNPEHQCSQHRQHFKGLRSHS